MKAARATKPRTRFVLRPYRRIPTWYGSYYMSGSVIGKGVVKNLSRTGLLGDPGRRREQKCPFALRSRARMLH